MSGGIVFNKFTQLTNGTLAPGNPDLYYGARPEQLNCQVRNELNQLITPSAQHDLPIIPKFYVAAKGPDRSLAVAGRQACYDGALGARSINALRDYADTEGAQSHNALAITSVYHGGQLKMFTSYRASSKESLKHPEYVMTHISAWAMASDRQTSQQGAAAYKNLRD